jgi:pSer/pThr/pTyr-binding forkhead associated (FHA) protein
VTVFLLPTNADISPGNPASVEVVYTNTGDTGFELSMYVYDDGSLPTSQRPQFEYKGKTYTTIPDQRKIFESLYMSVGETATITVVFHVTSDMETGTYNLHIGGLILDEDTAVNLDEKAFRLNMTGGTPPPTTPPQEPPRARIDILSAAGELQGEFVKGESVVFDGSKSYDPDGGTLTYLWVSNIDGILSDQSYFVTHTLSTGKHTITLTVTDDEGNTDTETSLITINEENTPPVADAGPDQTVTVNQQFTLDASASYDPDGTLVNYSWTFGPYPYSSKGGQIVTHSYSTEGEYTVTLHVTDDDGATGEDTVLITVTEATEPHLLIITDTVPDTLTINKEYEITVKVKAQNDTIKNLQATLKSDATYIDTLTDETILCGDVRADEEYVFSWKVTPIKEGFTHIDIIFTGDNIDEEKLERDVTIQSTSPPRDDSIYIFPSDLYEKSEDRGVTDATCALYIYYHMLDKGYTIVDSEDDAGIIILFGGPSVNSKTQHLNDVTLAQGWGFKNNQIEARGMSFKTPYDGIVGSLHHNNKIFIIIYGNGASGTIAATRGFLDTYDFYLENEDITIFNGAAIEELLSEYNEYSEDVYNKISYLEQQTVYDDYDTITRVYDYFEKLNEMNYIKSNAVQDAFAKIVLSAVVGNFLDMITHEVSHFVGNISITYTKEFLEYSRVENEYFVFASFTYAFEATEYSINPEFLKAATESWVCRQLKERVSDWITDTAVGAKRDFMLSEEMCRVYDGTEIDFVSEDEWKEIILLDNAGDPVGAQNVIKSTLKEFSIFEELKAMSRAVAVQQYPAVVVTALNLTDEDLLRAQEILTIERQRIYSNAYPGFWSELNDLESQYTQNLSTLTGEIQYFDAIEDILNVAKGFQQILSIFCTLSAKYTAGATEAVEEISSIANAIEFQKIAGRAITDDEKIMAGIVAAFVGEERALAAMRVNFCKEMTARQISLINALSEASKAGETDVTLSFDKNNYTYGEAIDVSVKENSPVTGYPKRFLICSYDDRIGSYIFYNLHYTMKDHEESVSTQFFRNLELSPWIDLDVKPDDFEASKTFHANGEDIVVASYVEIFIEYPHSSGGTWVAIPTKTNKEKVRINPFGSLDVIRAHESGLVCNTFWGYSGIDRDQVVSYNLVVNLPLDPALNKGAVVHIVNPKTSIGEFRRVFPLAKTNTMVYMINEGILYYPIEFYGVAVYDGSNVLHYIGLKDISGLGAFKVSSFPEHICTWKVVGKQDAEFILGSPADLHVYDSQERHVGINYSTGEIDEDIPGSHYEEIGDTVRIIIENATDTYRVEIVGKEDGEYHLTVSQPVEIVKPDGSTEVSRINIPVSSQIKKGETQTVEYDRDELSHDVNDAVSEIVKERGIAEMDEETESRIIEEASEKVVSTIDTDEDGIPDIKDLTPLFTEKGIPFYWLIIFGVIMLGIGSYVGRKTAKKVRTRTEAPTLTRGKAEAKIVVEGKSYTLVKSPTTIGRGKKADIRIPDPDMVVSRIHARIYQDEKGQYWIEDNNSTHGTFIYRDGTYKRIQRWALYERDLIVLCHDPKGGKQVPITFEPGKNGEPGRTKKVGKQEAEVIIEGKRTPLAKKVMIIGGSKKADIQIADTNGLVSRMHARIYRDDSGQYWIEDNSTHGTFIYQNGKYKKIQRWALYDGDVIVLCHRSKGGKEFQIKFRQQKK